MKPPVGAEPRVGAPEGLAPGSSAERGERCPRALVGRSSRVYIHVMEGTDIGDTGASVGF